MDRILYNQVSLAKSGMGGAPKGVVPMIERAIFILAALATIAAFALQAWRAWKDHLERKSEDAEEKGRGQ